MHHWKALDVYFQYHKSKCFFQYKTSVMLEIGPFGFAELMAKVCESWSRKSRGTMWGVGWSSLELLFTYFIKHLQCELLQTTSTRYISGLEIKRLLPHPPVGGFTLCWAVIGNSTGKTPRAFQSCCKWMAHTSRALLWVTWKPCGSTIPRGLLRVLMLMSCFPKEIVFRMKELWKGSPLPTNHHLTK